MSYFLTQLKIGAKARKTFFSKHPFLQSLAIVIEKQEPITSAEKYNSFLRELTRQIKKNQLPKAKNILYAKEISDITRKAPLTEPTDWGGVTLKKVDVAKDFIQKLLVVKKLGILGFEIHEKKLEKLEVLEGTCLVLFSNHAAKGWKKGAISLALAMPGDRFVFQPYDEHGIIALTDAVIQETSTNHLDDLTFIFASQQVA